MADPTLTELRDRLFAGDELPPQEMLALLIADRRGGRVAMEVAGAVLRDWGSPYELARAPLDGLTMTPGVGRATAATIAAAFALFRSAQVDPRHVTILGPQDIVRAARRHLLLRNVEHLVVLVTNGLHRVIHTQVVSMGGGDITLFPQPEILGIVLRRHGRAFALAHNHPCGDPTPSLEDCQATTRIAEAADTIGLVFLGQVVVTDHDWERVPVGVTTLHQRLAAGF